MVQHFVFFKLKEIVPAEAWSACPERANLKEKGNFF